MEELLEALFELTGELVIEGIGIVVRGFPAPKSGKVLKRLQYIERNGLFLSKTEEGERFRILQLTDTHLRTRGLKKALAEIDALLKKAKPDLVVITGDVVTCRLIRRKLDLLNRVFADHGVLWTLTLGNHDAEQAMFFDRKEFLEYCARLDHCLVRVDADAEHRYGDMPIYLCDATGKPYFALILLDSGDYLSRELGEQFGYFGKKKVYDAILPEQIERYRTMVRPDDTAPALPHVCFFHIPLPQFVDGYREAKQNGTVLYGDCRENEPGGVCCPPVDTGMFAAAKDCGCKAIFVGHDHINDFHVMYQGVRLCFGQKTCHTSYHYGNRRLADRTGGTIIEVAPSGEIDVRAILLKEDLGDANV